VQEVTKKAHDAASGFSRTPDVVSGFSRTSSAFERPVFARARRLCLSLPESSEKIAWGHPTFKAGQKMFCAFEIIKGRPSIAFRLPAKEAAVALKDVRCFASPYGRGLWVSVWVDGKVDQAQIGEFIERSYRTVATKRQIAALGVVSGFSRTRPT
jgi:predicted DNA-binding protein (MmcQ/YjbR family)